MQLFVVEITMLRDNLACSMNIKPVVMRPPARNGGLQLSGFFMHGVVERALY